MSKQDAKDLFKDGVTTWEEKTMHDYTDILYEEIAKAKDYIIEVGSNENGSWEKWASGKLVQWGFDITDTSSGELRRHNKVFPVPFVERNYIIIGSANTGAILNIDAPAFSRTSKSEVRVSIKRTTEGNVNYFWYAIGRWK